MEQREWGRLSPVSGEAVLDGMAGGRAARGHGQLAVDGTDMGMHGAGTEHQFVGDLLVGQAVCEQAQHLHFACGQPSRIDLWWWGSAGTRGWGGFVPLCCQCLLWRHGASVGPGGSEGAFSQVDPRCRERALIVSKFDGWDGHTKRVA